jgi:hypothetical protein
MSDAGTTTDNTDNTDGTRNERWQSCLVSSTANVGRPRFSFPAAAQGTIDVDKVG